MEIDATSPDGNAFTIIGLVKRILEETNRIDEWPDIEERMMSGDYNNLCDVAEEVTYGTITVINRNGSNEC